MRVLRTAKGNYNKSISWLKRMKAKTPKSALERIGRDGVAALSRATPVGETGETAAGWDYKVKAGSSGAEVIFFNDAHPEESANIVVLIHYGHGTGTGGYVPARPFIPQTLRPIIDRGMDEIRKEMSR